jgi:hypothetical protein
MVLLELSRRHGPLVGIPSKGLAFPPTTVSRHAQPLHPQVTNQTYLSKVADNLGMSVEALAQLNLDRIADLGAWLKPGDQLKVCNISIGAPSRAGPNKQGRLR